MDLELQGSSTDDSSLEVISMLAGGSSACAICWPATRANSLRSLIPPTSPARRLGSSLHSRPMSARKGTSAALFASLAEAGVNIRMIDQGSSEMNIIVGVEEKDFETAIKAIYGAFVE